MQNPQSLVIRDGIARDVQHCLALDHTYETDYVWQVSTREDTNSRSVTLRKDRLPRQMDALYLKSPERLQYALAPEQCFLVAMAADGEIHGYLVMTRGPAEPIAHLRDVVVERDVRRGGIAARLMKVAGIWARQNDIQRIIAETQTRNYPAICLYQKLGYSFCGYNDRYFLNQDIAVFFCTSVR
ncbi:MAG: GNAT family N-acetyltransferase [Chloroflexota bacterium]